MWCKHCNYKTSLHSTLIVKNPFSKQTGKTKGLVEFVDIFPTLADACRLPVPVSLEGKSFLPLLNNPNLAGKPFIIAKHENAMTIKTPELCYTEWIGKSAAPANRMLCNHIKDIYENENISEYAENKEKVEMLSKKLKENWGKDF